MRRSAVQGVSGLPIYNSRPASCRAGGASRSLSQQAAGDGPNPAMLEFAQTATTPMEPSQALQCAQKWPVRHVAAFQKYNSTARFIGFPPS
jgi:hypothetical protein